MTDRICCCVPHCRRTTAKDTLPYGFNEWVCQPHYADVDIKLKRQRAALRRRNVKRIDAERYVATDDRMWRRIKKQAIERAARI
ncbi:hypothetical protein [Rhizobium lusitanum]|uniref:hypothetical protein n=1 Tax=Rhizobium lusitanum TaxID=293958 RepID=UPI0019596048|nr:hypothetical protein [Rhizobium lusitanum]MBM7049708.1 hypothetical protein [Rhizobium lusitanum]